MFTLNYTRRVKNEKKLVMLLTTMLIGMFFVGCTTSAESSSTNEIKVVENKITEDKDKDTEEKTKEAIDKEITIGADEKVVLDFFGAMNDEKVEEAQQYILYSDLEFPFQGIEKMQDYYSSRSVSEIIGIEEISSELRVVKLKTKKENAEVEDNYLLKNIDGAWKIALQGVITRFKSTIDPNGVEDGKIGIYLKDIYVSYSDDRDYYVVKIINNTSEEFKCGFVNKGRFIYETENGKETYDLKEIITVNPYDESYIYFDIASSEGMISSIIMKEAMLGLQSRTSDVEVVIGEMVEY